MHNVIKWICIYTDNSCHEGRLRKMSSLYEMFLSLLKEHTLTWPWLTIQESILDSWQDDCSCVNNRHRGWTENTYSHRIVLDWLTTLCLPAESVTGDFHFISIWRKRFKTTVVKPLSLVSTNTYFLKMKIKRSLLRYLSLSLAKSISLPQRFSDTPMFDPIKLQLSIECWSHWLLAAEYTPPVTTR